MSMLYEENNQNGESVYRSSFYFLMSAFIPANQLLELHPCSVVRLFLNNTFGGEVPYESTLSWSGCN